uniref:Magnetosome protein Mad24 n=1 Tax=uncultured Nitrospirota bacterium TaxID=170969 RepID=A0A142BTY2_9BACT|nr:magnetosome protein Mad24 [uncultured Nitrospirota bacterium]
MIDHQQGINTDSIVEGMLKKTETELDLVKKQVKELEDKNDLLTKDVKILDLQLHEKRMELKKLLRYANEVSSKQLKPMIDENSLVFDTDFLQEELSRLNDVSDSVSEQLNEEIFVLGNIIMDIEFMKGEMKIYKESINSVQNDIPKKTINLIGLEDKIIQTHNGMKVLLNKMREINKSVKVEFYKKETV